MQVKFLQNLGSNDARECNAAHHTQLNYKDCVIDAVVDLPEAAVEFLGKKYNALFEPVKAVRGQAKQTESTGNAK